MITNSSATRTHQTPLGVILFEGASQLVNSPIVVVVTGFQRPSANEKTGNMLQTWILRSDMNPLQAIHTGNDASVCGDCPLRGMLEKRQRRTINRRRACYVAIHQAPLAVYAAYRRGRYQPFDTGRHHLILFAGRTLRLGSYGDPVAAPYHVWRPLVEVSSGHTGYTHQWRTGRFWLFRRFLMASVETLDDARVAQSRGWRTFRSAPAGELPVRGEFACPASAEQGKRITCDRCVACNGANGNPNRASVLIQVHGSPAVLSSYRKLGDDR